MLAFVQVFNHCDSQPLKTLEWWLFLKTYVHLQASTSQVLHLSCPKISNFGTDGQLKSHIQADQYQTVPHSRQSKPTYLSYLLNLFFNIFKSFSVFLWLNFEHCIKCKFCRFRCKSGTVYVLDNISNFLVDWYFSIFSPKTGKSNEASLAKWLSVRLRTKWFWVRVQLQKKHIWTLFTQCLFLYDDIFVLNFE